METPNDQPNQPCTCEGEKKESRRDFLLKVGLGLNVVAGAMIGIPLVGYALSSFVQQYPLQWISLGPVDNFPVGQTRLASYENPYRRSWDGATAHIPAWVRHVSQDTFQVFAINCTHLGCPVRWFEESKLFMCPCHGGVYYEDGTHASGPPPRPLFTYDNKVENGELWVKGGILPTLAEPQV
jgi:Rieske Fe-S protein